MTRRRGVGNGRTEVVDVVWDVQSTMYKHGQGGLSAVNLGQVRKLHQVPDPNPTEGSDNPTTHQPSSINQYSAPTPHLGRASTGKPTKCLSQHFPSTSSSTSPQHTVRAIRLLMPTHLSREQHHASQKEIPPKYNKKPPLPVHTQTQKNTQTKKKTQKLT